MKTLDEVSDIKVNASTREFNRKMDRAKRKADDIPSLKITHLLVTGFKDYQRRMDRVATSLRTFDEIARGIGSGGLMLGLPALTPLLSVAAGGVMALGSAFTSAGLGAAGFASVAIPAISGVMKANEALAEAQQAIDDAGDEEERAAAMENLTNIQKQYSKVQLDSANALKEFTQFYKEFAKEFEPDILGIFNKSLGTLQSTLTAARPAIEGVVTSVNNLVDSFNKNLATEDMRAFFDWLGRTAGPYLEGMVKGVGNFAAGLLNMFVAFDPLAQGFVDGFLRMSEQFRTWTSTLSENPAFQEFVQFVQENTPTVLSLIGNIVTTLINFAVSMAPLSVSVLEMADSFFAWTSELFKNNEWLAKIIGFIPILVGLFKLFMPVVNALTSAFKFLWPIISTAFTWFGKLGVGIQKVFPIVTRIGTMLLRFAGGPVGIVVQAVIALALAVASNWDTIWSKTKEIFSAVGGFLSDTWNDIKSFFTDTVGGIVDDTIGFFADMYDGVAEWMGDVLDSITDTWDEVMDFLGGIDLFDMGANIIEGLTDGIKSMASDAVESVKGVVDGAIEGAKNLLGIASPSKLFRQFGQFTGEGFIIGMDRMESKVTAASERMARVSTVGAFGVSQPSYASYPSVSRPSGTDNTDNSAVLQALLRESQVQSEELRKQKNMIIEMDKREVGRVVEPEVSRRQNRKEGKRKKFA
jgi:hypothetical protein